MRSWSAASFAGVENPITSTAVELGSILTRRMDPIDRTIRPLSELNVIAKVTFGGELALRGDEAKRGYKGPLFQAFPGDLIISKIRVGQGSFTLVPDTLGHLAVSPEYPVYALDPERIDGSYLGLILRSPEFLGQLTRSASGNTTKQRISPSYFESLRIPLPALEDQQRMAAAHAAAITAAEALEAEAAQTEAEALAAFEAALGLAVPALLPDRPVFIARFRDIDRWSHEGALRSSVASHVVSDSWPMVKLKDIGTVNYGLQKSPANRPGTHPRPYLRVANVQRDRLDLREVKTINVPDDDMPRLKLEFGDLLLCEGNSPDLVGRGAIWRGEIADCIHQNHILKVRLDPNQVKPEFVMAVINSGHGQAYFRSKAKRTTNLASINSTEVRELPLPLPPLEKQQALTKALAAARAHAATLRQRAREDHLSARSDFETAVSSAVA